MTNIFIILPLWINLVTNPIPAGITTNGDSFFEVNTVSSIQQYLPDGAFLNASTMTHHSYVTNYVLSPLTNPTLRTIKQYNPPPLPPSTSLRISGASITLTQAPNLENGGPDNDNFCLMFKTNFMTETNKIYSLESSTNLITWQLCSPQIDGTGQMEYFFDDYFNDKVKLYRITFLEGVLPEIASKQ